MVMEERPNFLHRASALEASSSQLLFFVIFIGLKLSVLFINSSMIMRLWVFTPL